jgi:hypothetical protein
MTSTISPLWRFLVTDLDGSSITLLDSLASERMVTPKLNEALELTGTVPSDSDYVNRLHTDGFPLVAEGVRQLYGFRRESDTVPYYTNRASTLLMQVNDASTTGDARTRFTGWDPWQYLFSRPVLQSNLATIGRTGPAGTSGLLIPAENLYYPQSVSADEIIVDILFIMFSNADVTSPVASQNAFIDWGLSGFYTGTIETCPAPAVGASWEIQQGTSVGQALQDICASGACDIIMEPIYDPVNRPGELCQISIYSQGSPAYGAGSYNYNAIFSWDRPGRSVVGIDDMFDGTNRANHIIYYNGQGGPPIATYASAEFRDATSIATYGEYAPSQFFPAQTVKQGVKSIAAQQLALRANFKQTLTVNPAPERSPEPFVDYYLGDRVPVYASDNLRQEIPPSGSYDPFSGPTAWQRVYGIPVEIDDNGVETVRELLVGPVGGPPPVTGPAAPQGIMSQTTNQTNAYTTRRVGSVRSAR